jgi:hypothetical protein
MGDGVKPCETCYGEGQVPTDEGLVTCPDCGGAGSLPSPGTLVEWRLRAIEEAQEGRNDDAALDLRWLAFELRRARDALTELVALIDDLDETPARTRMRFIANGALNLYAPMADKAAASER